MSRMKYKDANGEWRYADMALEWENGGGSDTESDLIVDIEIDSNPNGNTSPNIISTSINTNKTLAELVAIATTGILSVSGGYKFISSGYTEWYPFYINSCAVVSAEMINILLQYGQVSDQTDSDGISIAAWYNAKVSSAITVKLEHQYIIYHSSNTDELVVIPL